MASQPFNFAAARALLAGPLKFGDPDMIAARQLIETLEDCKTAIRKCPHDPKDQDCEDCDGEGECSHCGAECETCLGTGKNEDCEDPCDCLDGFENLVIEQAKREVKTKSKKAA